MLHFQLIFYIISFASGAASVTAVLLAYRHYQKEGALYFALLLISFSIIQLELILLLYKTIVNSVPHAITIMAQILDMIGGALMMFALPRLIKTSLGLKLKRLDRIISFLLPLLALITMIFRYALELEDLRVVPLGNTIWNHSLDSFHFY
jgi:hypothetical protein